LHQRLSPSVAIGAPFRQSADYLKSGSISDTARADANSASPYRLIDL
jgi:hypothetical protein